MRLEMLDLMRLIANGIVADETMAASLAKKAAGIEDTGDIDGAASMRAVARRHRVKAMELDGRLAVLRLEYASRFHNEPESRS